MDQPAEPAAPAAVHAAFALTAADVAQAARLHARAMQLRPAALASLAIMMLVLCSFATTLFPRDHRLALAVVGCGMVGGLAAGFARIRWLVPAQARRSWTRTPLMRRSLLLDADAEAVRIGAEGGAARMPWPEVVRLREDAVVVLLYLSERLYHVVPKRALTPAGIDALRFFHSSAAPASRRGKRLAGDGGARGLDWVFDNGPPSAGALAVSATWLTTVDDLAAAQRLHLRRRWRRPAGLASPIVWAVIAVAAFSAANPSATGMQIANTAGGMLLLFVTSRGLFYAALPLLLRNFRRRQPNLSYPWRVELDRQGMRAVTPQQDVRVAWGDYVAWAADARVLLVYQSDALFQFIPARAVDPAFLATFRDLAAGLPRR